MIAFTISMREILASLSSSRLALVRERLAEALRLEARSFCRGLLDIGFGIRAPNTALEPTADKAWDLPGSVGLVARQFGGGSAFGR